ncbi:MAG: hypothetical protein NTY17_02105 [Planctomycetia bacterium]|nr:hypothetical protein [Planctomycetia bacterium]
MKHLKGMEISCSKATAALVKHLDQIPVEYLALEYGVNTPASDAIVTVKSIPTLRRLKLGGTSLTDSEITALAGATQLEELSFGILDLPDERLPQLQAFAFLKSLRIVPTKKPFSAETQAKIEALFPKTSSPFSK